MALMTVVVLVLGVIAYGVHLRAATLPGLILTLLLGTAAFTTLGIGITRFIPNAESAPVVVNLVVLPLTFISSIWFPSTGCPRGSRRSPASSRSRRSPTACSTRSIPATTAPALNGADLRTLAIWTAIGVWLMIRFLRQPQGEVA